MSSDTTGRRHGGFFGGGRRRFNSHGNDPTILAARQKVTDASNAERDADRALSQARNSVKEAREHVKNLEREAREGTKRAKFKQAQSEVVSKTARALGRHG
ncbi:uncharacterized protein ARMOST_00410 [Armillaria ostoyae]|uniref:Uncharacterized protein n=2 Tax=Armillaria TaxID=47424 RepID=A0A284QL12_ARMOS|nr:hypothetical protein ARMSODRAFT_1015131 [Armillaria solidipes]SJK97159.1 uncharacterized protein ARMOST_00410 [Armillaria ostoyae]